MILIGSLIICGNAFPQSVNFSLDLPDLKEWYKQTEEYPIFKELAESQAKTIAELKTNLALKEKELELEQRENEINKRIIEVKDMEIKVLNNNFNQMKDVADRAIKLAETSKPKSNWELYGLLGVAAFVIGLAVGL
jgi:predicted sugar kinase